MEMSAVMRGTDMLPTRAMNMGRLLRTMLELMTTIDPEKTPAHPQPAIARPTINIRLFIARPHTRLPSSKMDKADRKAQRTLKWAKTRPKVSWNAHEVWHKSCQLFPILLTQASNTRSPDP